MRIAFICGSAEPGRDGVGDYVATLAAELLKRKCEILIIAVADSFVLKNKQETRNYDNNTCNVFRFAIEQSLDSRFQFAREVLDDFSPHLISIQFVAFMFNRKGLPLGLSKHVIQLTNGIPFHLMFHELWVGMSKESSLKQKIWGKVQKQIIRSFIQKIRPSSISTQTLLYQEQLKLIGFAASYLPLFSNIPVVFQRNKPPVNNTSIITFIVFGTIHANAPIASFAMEAVQFATEQKKDIMLIFIGRCGREQGRWIETCKAKKLNYLIKGEQSTSEISYILSTATFGLNTTAFPLIEKSGTLAAMEAHGLPVISLSGKWTSEIPIDNVLGYAYNVIKYEQGRLKEILKEPAKQSKSNNTIDKVATSFLQLVSKSLAK